MAVPYSFSLARRISAIRSSVPAEYTTPVGLLGVLMITPLVLGVIFCSNSSRLGWKVSVSGETTTKTPS